MKYLKALYHIWQLVDFGRSKGSCGVWIFKLRKDNPFNEDGGWHDKQYQKINWPDPTQDSIDVDNKLFRRLISSANGNQDLIDEAYVLYAIARTWGKMRWGMARVGIIWSVTKSNEQKM
jgi:hypothetical protein